MGMIIGDLGKDCMSGERQHFRRWAIKRFGLGPEGGQRVATVKKTNPLGITPETLLTQERLLGIFILTSCSPSSTFTPSCRFTVWFFRLIHTLLPTVLQAFSSPFRTFFTSSHRCHHVSAQSNCFRSYSAITFTFSPASYSVRSLASLLYETSLCYQREVTRLSQGE